jgi:hypothetical protein
MVIVKELSASGVLSGGGWDPRYAVALAIASCDDVAGALIDTNGDEADIDLDEYERDANGNWHAIGSGSAGGEGTSWSTRVAATWGRGAPGEIVKIDYLGQSYSISASPAGWWLFVMPSTEDFNAAPQQRTPAS